MAMPPILHVPPVRHRYSVEHALPFATMFEELAAIRGDGDALADEVRLTEVIDACLPGAGTPYERLKKQLAASEHAYNELEKKKRGKDYKVSEDVACAEADGPLLEILHRTPRTALCLSGGGIRSASYSLGVLQALAEFNDTNDKRRCQKNAGPSVLEEFDYLSTVSGGGYIGSWLMAWTYRLTRQMSPRAAFQKVAGELAGCMGHTSGDPAPRAVRHLREYTSFLAPTLGLTLDVWTLAALVLRNLIVNWAMILPLMLALIAGLQTLHYGVLWLSVAMTGFSMRETWWIIGGLFVFSGIMAGFRMPSTRLEERAKWRLGSIFVFCVFILPLLVGSLLIVELWLNLGAGWAQQPFLSVLRMAVVTFLTLVSVPIIRGSLTKDGRAVVHHEHKLRTYLFAGVAAAFVTSMLLAMSLQIIGTKVFGYLPPGNTAQAHAVSAPQKELKEVSLWAEILEPLEAIPSRHVPKDPYGFDGPLGNRFVLFAFPVLWLLLIAASAFFSGFLGIFEEDIDREWWARAGGLMLSTLGAWLVAEALVIYAPTMVHWIAAGSAGVVAGLGGALGGASTAGGVGAAGVKSADVSKLGKFLNKFDMVVPALCAVALLILGAFVAVLERWLSNTFGGSMDTEVHLKIFLLAALVGLLANWAININIFSLHGMYRMRLMRAFLGASNTRRLPNPFTGFDVQDNLDEQKVPIGRGLPLHLVNATVNLVGTKKLAWRQRKAEGFTFSPLHCGGWRLGYVATAHYGAVQGLSLGTAMAISGAAFNPNMGYHSSPMVTLLMTLFNVRLGWWLPNPKYKRTGLQQRICAKLGLKMEHFLEKKAPRLALGPLVREALGATDDQSAYVELTDGGHFENLGLYEMVLRRAKLIVVVDAGADPKCQLEDLGNALRKIEIDLGIPIVFRDGIHMKKGAHKDNMYCALAKIHYDYVDQVASASAGDLLYIKAGITGEEPPDVTQYAKTHPTFPHESTANQFFNEAQFESYRHLGHHAVRTILHQVNPHTIALDPLDEAPDSSVAALFRRAKAYTATVSPVVGADKVS
jgi:Patatin-like phospholipase